MEWLGLLLLYLISGYMKKRQQKAKNREIELDPDWDIPEESSPEKSKSNIEQMLQNLFDQARQFEPEAELKQQFEKESDLDDLGAITEELNDLEDQILEQDEDDLSKVDEKVETFEEKIYHSELADRNQQHFGNKWEKKKKLRLKLFGSNKTLKTAIILKEVLDKPIGLR